MQDIKKHLRKQFDGSLARVRFELENSIVSIDVMDNQALEEKLSLFNSRLVVFQHDFLKHCWQVSDPNADVTEEFDLPTPSASQIPDLAAAALAGGSTAVALTTITAGTTGALWWTSSVSAGTVLAGWLGVSTAVVTGGATVIVGGGVFAAIKKLAKKRRRRKRIKRILKTFNTDVSEQLTEWANGVING